MHELAGPGVRVCSCTGLADALHFGLMAADLIPLDDITRMRVLVVHTNFAVGSAIARRLIDADVIALVHAGSVLDGNQDPTRYDVTLLCPYLPADQRDLLVAACLTAGDGALVELVDSDQGSRVLVHRSAGVWPQAADAIAEALALPLEGAKPV